MKNLMFVAALFAVACGPGEDGPQGPPGPQGEPGVRWKSTKVCQGTLLLDTGGSVRAVHRIVDFTDGSVFTSCDIGTASISTGSSGFWGLRSTGPNHGACLITFDVDAVSGGYWAFEATADRATTRVDYSDPSSPLHRSRWTLTCADGAL